MRHVPQGSKSSTNAPQTPVSRQLKNTLGTAVEDDSPALKRCAPKT